MMKNRVGEWWSGNETMYKFFLEITCKMSITNLLWLLFLFLFVELSNSALTYLVIGHLTNENTLISPLFVSPSIGKVIQLFWC